MEIKAENIVKAEEEESGEIKKDKLAFSPVLLNEDEEKIKKVKEQLAVDQELQRRVKDNEDVYESELALLKNIGQKFELRGRDPVGINGVIFVPDTVYTIGNRIVSPDGIQLITYDIMQCALTIDSTAIRSEKKIHEVGGGTMEIKQDGRLILQTTKT